MSGRAGPWATLGCRGRRRTGPIEGWRPAVPARERGGPRGGGGGGTALVGSGAGGREGVVKGGGFPGAIEADGLAAWADAGVPTPRVMAAEGDLLVL